MPTSMPTHQTVGLTPAIEENFGPQLNDDEVCKVNVFIFASDHDTGQGYWHVQCLMRRMIGMVLGGVTGELFSKKTVVATAWTAVVTITEGKLTATMTGGLGQTVDWMVTTDDSVCMAGAYVPPN